MKNQKCSDTINDKYKLYYFSNNKIEIKTR